MKAAASWGRAIRLGMCGVCFAGLATAASAASVDYFLKIDGVDIVGEDTPTGKGATEVLSYSWGLSQGKTNSAGAVRLSSAGKAVFKEFTITKRIDKSSPILAKAMVDGSVVDFKVRLFREVEETPSNPLGVENYLIIDMKGGRLLEYKPEFTTGGGSAGGGTSGDPIPTESISFSFSTIEMTHPPSGNKFTYDLKKNEKI